MSAKILVIEDNEQNMYLMRFLLQKNGFVVIGAKDGAQGIETAYRERPDLILLDIQLPVMDGYVVAKKLKDIPELKEVPVIAVTSFAMPADKQKALEAGATGYIEKPINPDIFIKQIGEFLPSNKRE